MVFNHAAFLVGAIAAVVAIVVDKEAAPADHVVLLAGAGAGTAVALALELLLRRAWRPRVFWIVPVWMVGVAGVGGGVLAAGAPVAGAAVIGAAALAFAVHVARYARKPGGRWVGVAVATLTGILAETLAEQALTGAKPWWGYAIRGVLLAVGIYALVRMWIERARAAHVTGA